MKFPRQVSFTNRVENPCTGIFGDASMTSVFEISLNPNSMVFRDLVNGVNIVTYQFLGSNAWYTYTLQGYTDDYPYSVGALKSFKEETWSNDYGKFLKY